MRQSLIAQVSLYEIAYQRYNKDPFFLSVLQPVSYTHLDVYKRQQLTPWRFPLTADKAGLTYEDLTGDGTPYHPCFRPRQHSRHVD